MDSDEHTAPAREAADREIIGDAAPSSQQPGRSLQTRGSSTEGGDELDYPSNMARTALDAVLSDDHNEQAGDAALRKILTRVAAEGDEGLQRLAFDIVIKLAELTERVAVAQGLHANDVADILFVD